MTINRNPLVLLLLSTVLFCSLPSRGFAEPTTLESIVSTQATLIYALKRELASLGGAVAQVSSESVGAVQAWIGKPEEVPSGWLICDGRTVTQSAFPNLFKALGHLYGGSGDSFVLPDLRGTFLRGVDAGKGRDRDADRRVNSQGAIVGDRVGSEEGYATARPRKDFSTAQDGGHTHAAAEFDRLMSYTKTGTVYGRTDEAEQFEEPNLTRSSTMSQGFHKHKVTEGGDDETRPVNVSVYWIIKAR